MYFCERHVINMKAFRLWQTIFAARFIDNTRQDTFECTTFYMPSERMSKGVLSLSIAEEA